MGNWAKWELGKSELPKRCYLFAGNTPENVKNEVLNNYNEIIFHKHDNYEPYIVSDGNKETLLLFQVYGAPMVADLLTILHDGNVEEVIFIGSTYGISKNLNVGDYIIPDKVQSLDGILRILDNEEYTYPNKETRNKIIQLMSHSNEKYHEGTTTSVPATFWHPDKSRYDKNTIALEMEFASLCHFSNKLSIKSAGILIVSDTHDYSLIDDPTLRYKNIIKAFKILKQKSR